MPLDARLINPSTYGNSTVGYPSANAYQYFPQAYCGSFRTAATAPTTSAMGNTNQFTPLSSYFANAAMGQTSSGTASGGGNKSAAESYSSGNSPLAVAVELVLYGL